jgi:hypothetical protein
MPPMQDIARYTVSSLEISEVGLPPCVQSEDDTGLYLARVQDGEAVSMSGGFQAS